MSDELSRRDFLRATALISVCACGGLMAGCANNASDSTQKDADGDEKKAPNASLPTATSNADGTLTIAGGGALKPGAALLFTLPENKEPAFVFKAKNGELHAVSAKCTHVGCTVAWQAAPEQFVCPCHKSRFSAEGAVLNGPARAPLPRYIARAKGRDAIISLKS